MFEDKKDEEIVSIAGRSSEENSAPVEMTRRLKNSIKKLDKTTARYSIVLICLTIVLVIIAILQIVLAKLTDALSDWIWVVFFVVMSGIIIYGGKLFLGIKNKK